MDSEGRLKLLPERKVEIRIEGAGSIQGFGSANHLNGSLFSITFSCILRCQAAASSRLFITRTSSVLTWPMPCSIS